MQDATNTVWAFYESVEVDVRTNDFIGALWGLIDLKDPRAADALADLLWKGCFFYYSLIVAVARHLWYHSRAGFSQANMAALATPHWEAATREAREALVVLGQLPLLRPFYLAGGTAFALRLGHRISLDLNLFANIETLMTTCVGGLWRRCVRCVRSSVRGRRKPYGKIKTKAQAHRQTTTANWSAQEGSPGR